MKHSEDKVVSQLQEVLVIERAMIESKLAAYGITPETVASCKCIRDKSGDYREFYDQDGILIGVFRRTVYREKIYLNWDEPKEESHELEFTEASLRGSPVSQKEPSASRAKS